MSGGKHLIRELLKIETVPTRTIVECDWQAVAERVKKRGAMLVDPSTNANSGHAQLHKHGIGIYQLKVAGELIAYSIEPLRERRKRG